MIRLRIVNEREEISRRNSLRRRSVRLLLVVTVLLAVGDGVAHATIPDNEGSSTAVGTIRLRVYDPASGPNTLPIACTPTEGTRLEPHRTAWAAGRHRTFSVPFGQLVIDCNSTAPFVEFEFFNDSGGSLNVFTGKWDGSLDFDVVDAGGSVERDDDGTQRWTLQLADGTNSTEIDIWVTGNGGDCHAIVHSTAIYLRERGGGGGLTARRRCPTYGIG